MKRSLKMTPRARSCSYVVAPLLLFVFFFAFIQRWSISRSQPSIPPAYDGFLYGADGGASIMVEAFMDPLCPDSRDSWPPLKQALAHYKPAVSLIVHPFPLPYHDNSFVACRALHIARNMNASATFPLLEMFFDYQEKWYNSPTLQMSRGSIIYDIAESASAVVGNSSLPAFLSGFGDSLTDRAARNSFKYGCLRGVTGAPFFLVNGFPLPRSGSALDYEEWVSIIDPLLGRRVTKRRQSMWNDS